MLTSSLRNHFKRWSIAYNASYISNFLFCVSLLLFLLFVLLRFFRSLVFDKLGYHQNLSTNFAGTMFSLTTLFLASVVTWLVYAVFYSRPRKGLPPGPKAWPIIGNLNLVYKNEYFHHTLQKLSSEYGGIFSLQMSLQPTIVINDAKILQEALVEKAEYFSDRPLHLTLVQMIFQDGGIVFKNGEDWSKVRRLVLSSMRNFGLGKASLEDRIQDEVQYMMKDMEENCGKAFKFKYTFHKTVSNIICSILFGRRFEYSDQEYVTLLDDLTYLLSKGDFQNFAIFLDVVGLVLSSVIQPSIILTLISNIKTKQFAKRRLQEHRETFDPDNIRDFLDMCLDAESKLNTDGACTDGTIFQTIMDMFFAGTETSSTTLLWLFLFFIKHPEIQEKCRTEIITVVGPDRRPCLKDKKNMPYLEATTLEVLRIASAAPIGGLHNTAKTTTLAGYTIPKDTVVITNFYAVHLDPKLWPDPMMFKPERFLDDKGNLQGNLDNWVPFGIGKRKCLGDNLARTELFLIITNLLQRFRFKAVDDKLPGIQDAKLGVNLIPPEYEIFAELL